MIDSIVLKIPIARPIDKSLFTRQKTHEMHGITRAITLSSDSARKHKKEGIYSPQISIETHRRVAPARNVSIQVSVPKLLYGNNLFEVNDSCLMPFVNELQRKLEEFGLRLRKEEILSATVHRIDYAKVIKLPSHTSPENFINKLDKAGYRPRADLTRRDIRSGKEGYWMKFYNSTSSLTIYDKMLEIRKQGYTSTEKELQNLLLKRKLSKNVIKFEVSLQKPQKLVSILNRVCQQKKMSYSLEEVFSEAISKKVLLHYLAASFNNDVDFLCHAFAEQNLRVNIRNLYGYQRNKIALFFLLEEIKERGTEIVLKEVQMLHGYAIRKRYEGDLENLHLKLQGTKSLNLLPVAFLHKALNEFILYTHPIK